MKRRLLLAGGAVALFLGGCGPANPFKPGPPPFARPGAEEEASPESREGLATGAVQSVPMDENEHVHTVLEMLRSHVAGLQVRELPSGQIQLRLRGEQQSLRTDDDSNQPLLVIDDMPILPTAIREALLGIVPRDVASIHVLKDVSSTAIYGSRGANGVIVIRLKR